MSLLGDIVEDIKTLRRKRPDWADPDYVVGRAYDAILEIEKEKRNYIKRHKLANDYNRKESYWQINANEVARYLNTTRSSLMNRHSEELKAFIDRINQTLRAEKERRLEKYRQYKLVGRRSRSKDELLERNKALETEVVVLKNQFLMTALDIVESTLSKEHIEKLCVPRKAIADRKHVASIHRK